MRWKYKTWVQELSYRAEWKPWFAWKPIFLNGTAYWLETMEVFDQYSHSTKGSKWKRTYRPIVKGNS